MLMRDGVIAIVYDEFSYHDSVLQEFGLTIGQKNTVIWNNSSLSILEMHQNLDVELSTLKGLFAVQQNNIFWDVTEFTEDWRLGKT
jgi:hypothetical protein